MASTRRAPSEAPEIRVGARVRYEMPGGPLFAEVIEDRGNVGWRGRRIVRIRPFSEYQEEREPFEVPAEDLTLSE